jgi:hypothetical protein
VVATVAPEVTVLPPRKPPQLQTQQQGSPPLQAWPQQQVLAQPQTQQQIAAPPQAQLPAQAQMPAQQQVLAQPQPQIPPQPEQQLQPQQVQLPAPQPTRQAAVEQPRAVSAPTELRPIDISVPAPRQVETRQVEQAEPRGIGAKVFSTVSGIVGSAANATGDTINFVIDLPGRAISAGGRLIGPSAPQQPQPQPPANRPFVDSAS